MSLRRFEIADLDACVDMYLDFMNALRRGDEDPWTENAVAERLRGILESPAFEGWVLVEGGSATGFMLGERHGGVFDVLEMFSAAGRDVRATAARMLKEAAPLLKAEGFARIGSLSNELWTAQFFGAQGFSESDGVRLFEFPL